MAGSARIASRIWLVYWAHVASFVAVVATLAAVDHAIPGGHYLDRSLNLWPLLADPAQRLAEFATLTYVPNYFDILPMYFVILALIPPAMAIERSLGGRAVLAVSAVWWLAALYHRIELPAERWGTRAILVLQSLLLAADLLPRFRIRPRHGFGHPGPRGLATSPR